MDANVLSKMSPKRIEALAAAGVFTDSKIKDIEHAKEFSDDTKHHVRDAHDSAKEDKQLEQLKKIDEKLGGLTAKTEDGDVAVQALLKKGIFLDKKNTASLKNTFQATADEAEIAHKEGEIRLQTAITQQMEETKAGRTTEAAATGEIIKGIKKALVETKTTMRNSNEGIKKVDKPKEESDSK